MKKTLAQITLLAACLVIPHVGLSGQDSVNLQDKLMKGGTEAKQTLDLILTNAESTTAENLFIAAGAAFEQERFADSAYLFYIAKFRASFDEELFPPVGTGGSNPMIAFGALSYQLGSMINPEIMRRPTEFTEALEKTKNWMPEVPEGYNPGWKYTEQQDLLKAKDSLAETRRKFDQGMGGIATLLSKPEYFSAFKTVQAYNMTFDDSLPSEEKYNESVATMTQIEKDSGIEGMFYKSKEK